MVSTGLVLTIPAAAAAAARPLHSVKGAGAGPVHEARVHTHGGYVTVAPSGRSGIAHTPHWLATHPATSASYASKLPYQGGPVVTGAPRVYLIFWGSQWGNASTGSDGYQHYGGDPQGVAPVEQSFFAGLGTGSESWDGVMTQYCQGVANGATSCPSSSTHVGYPTGGALAGVWEDTAARAPAQATANQIAAEAVLAAGHFGNTNSSSNANAQYVIISPTGTNPDDYLNSGFCAWHSDTGSTYGDVAYTNMPYMPDAGRSCYAYAVNSSGGALDGVTVVGGHEYAETITDPSSPSAWWDSNDNTGGENGDKCSLGLGFSGENLHLTTGTFAVQPTYGNDGNGGSGGCEFSHAIVGSGGPTTFTASVNLAGSGTGSVTSSPGGIDCGTTCSAPYTSRQGVTLLANPATDSTFAGWSGDCSGTGNCQLTMIANMSVTATFTSSSGGGNVTVTGSLAGGYGTVGPYRYYHVYKAVTYWGAVDPNLAGEPLRFELERFNGTSWVQAGNWTFALGSSSQVGIRFPAYYLSRGRYAIRDNFGGDVNYGPGDSAWFYFRVTR